MHRHIALVLCTTAFAACGGGDSGTSSLDTDKDTADVIIGEVSGDTITIVDSAQPEVDTAGEGTCASEGGFGCGCASNDECVDELCIEGPDGNFCTRPCVTECPAGYGCLNTSLGGSDPISICVPQHTRLCRPCSAAADCQSPLDPEPAACVPGAAPEDGSFCATSCATTPCPAGYDCEDVAVGDATARLCRPSDDTCECRPSWAALALSTDCARTNANGTCHGTRTCDEDGLTACSAPPAAAEVCDGQDEDCSGTVDDIAPRSCSLDNAIGSCPGVVACGAGGGEECVGDAPALERCNSVDDDCDGTTDEGSCDDGLACTVDVCTGAACTHDLAPGTCRVAGFCYEAGEPSPDDPCKTCQPAVATDAFTLAEAVACDDFDACTRGDTCHEGHCAGTAYTCDDGLACTRDACDGDGGCSAPLGPNACLIQGVCYANGDERAADGCEVCDSARSTTQWSGNEGKACDDGDACSEGDVCSGTNCLGTPFECDDGDACTVDACDGRGGCTHSVASARCNIGGECFAAGTTKPGEACFVCDPDKSASAWSTAAPGAACDDGDSCTADDACNNGLCRGNAYSCDDHLACTTDVCDGAGGCAALLAADTCVVDGVCVAGGGRKTAGGCLGCVPTASTKVWTALDGAACDDGVACTKDDTCAGETCGGTSYACDDNNACTIDSCNGDGTCANVQAETSCIIAGICYAAGTVKQGESCLACRPEVSTSQWSAVAPNTPCDDLKACTANDVCTAGVCGGARYTCDDGLACTTDACDGDGGCEATVKAGSCVIDGACHVAGDLSAPGACRVCDPSADSGAWSPRTGQGCNDGDDCTEDDVCQGESCTGTAYACDDGIACTADSCDGDGTCTFRLAAGACLIGGVCYPDGAQKPGEPCYACRPDISGSTWSPALVGTECDDHNACTSEDECSNGLCAGTPYVCNDGHACTTDACDGTGGCTATIVPNNCLIGGQCIAAGTLETPNGCRWCDPTVDPNGWSAHTGAACNDGNACTKNDTCAGSTCGGTAYTCDDGLACTADACNGDGTCSAAIAVGSCVIGGQCWAENAGKPGDACLACRPSLANNDWRPVNNGGVCNDGNACTKNDQCTGGICFGASYTCDDGKPCTSDRCNGDGTCAAPIDPGSCLISGTCYDDGDTLGAGASACFVCDSLESQQTWVPNDGAPCNDGAACTQLDVCAGTTCAGAAYSCDDANACTLDACNGSGGCTHTQAANSCIIGGVCYAAGVAKPGEPCFACRPEINGSTWSPVAAGSACNDGNACTKNDQCNGGVCAGSSYTCNDNLACTTDTCDGAGGCGATVNSGSCAIGGACYANGALQSAGGCLVCNAAVAPTSWSPNGGAACNDGVACTSSDVCSGSTCGGTAYNCNDNLTCTADSCNGNGTCTFAQTANTCLIAGVCYAANTLKADNACLQCRPDVSATTWSAVAGTPACNDGNACTSGDKCGGGSCAGTPYICNDNLACTTDSCNGDGTCAAAVTTGCAIGGACYADGTVNPSNPCKVCNAAANKTDWSNRAQGTSCSDGNLCSYGDVCNATGTCGGTAYSCDDGKSCTQDACTGVQGGCTNTPTVGCLIGGACVAEGTFNPSNPCQQCLGATSRTSYSANNGNSCNDNNSCTYTDRCNGGVCGGTAYGCDDGLSCTTNACNGAGGCSYPLIGGNCLIGGTCYSNGTTQPGNVCLKCNTASSTTAWSANNVSCNDNDSCSDNDFCSGGVCDGVDRRDGYETNNTRPGPAIANINDCAALTERQLTASLYGPGDVDFYSYTHTDAGGCDMYPYITLINIPPGLDYDLYVYFRCKNGNGASLSCLSGSKSMSGGCYSDHPNNESEIVQIDPSCSFGQLGDDSGYIDIEVRYWSGVWTCQSYTLTWGDD